MSLPEGSGQQESGQLLRCACHSFGNEQEISLIDPSHLHTSHYFTDPGLSSYEKPSYRLPDILKKVSRGIVKFVREFKTMAPSQRYQTPSQASSSARSFRAKRSSSSSLHRPPDPVIFSTPEPRGVLRTVLSSSSAAQSRTLSRASTRTLPGPPTSSPQLPPFPQRQRFSLQPTPLQNFSPARPGYEAEGDEPGHEHQLSPEDADALNEIIMAIDMKNNGNVGCAYYITARETLYLLEDVAVAGTDLVETLLLHANPTTVLISARSPDTLANQLERGAQGVDGNRGESRYLPMSESELNSNFRGPPRGICAEESQLLRFPL